MVSLVDPSVPSEHETKRTNLLGIFLYAKLVMNNLTRQPNRRDFQYEISAARLPSELNDAYVVSHLLIPLRRKDLGTVMLKA